MEEGGLGTRAAGRRQALLEACWRGASVRGKGRVLRLIVVMVAPQCACPHCHGLVHVKLVTVANVMTCKMCVTTI